MFGGYNISKKDLLIYVIASQALLSVLRIIHLACDAGYNDRYCWVCKFFPAWC